MAYRKKSKVWCSILAGALVLGLLPAFAWGVADATSPSGEQFQSEVSDTPITSELGETLPAESSAEDDFQDEPPADSSDLGECEEANDKEANGADNPAEQIEDEGPMEIGGDDLGVDTEGDASQVSVSNEPKISNEQSGQMASREEATENQTEETCTVYADGWWPVDDPELIQGAGAPDRFTIKKGSTIAENPEVLAYFRDFNASLQENQPTARFIGWAEIPVDWALGGNLNLIAEYLTVNTPRYDFGTPINDDVALVSLWLVKEDSAGDESIFVGGSTGITAEGDLDGANIPDGAYVKIDAVEVGEGSTYDKLLVVLGDGKCILDGVYQVDMTVDGSAVHDGFGQLTLSFPVNNKKFGGNEGDWVVVWHLHNDGKITSERVQVVDGRVSVTVRDLSTFAIGLPESEENEGVREEDSSVEANGSASQTTQASNKENADDGKRSNAEKNNAQAEKSASSMKELPQSGDKVMIFGPLSLATAGLVIASIALMRMRRNLR